MTAGELRLILNELSPTMALIAELAYETAMRRSEILKLTVNCLHLEQRIVDVVDGKNGTRSVPLTLRAIELLEEAQRLAIVLFLNKPATG
nr:tyrosine-type recombinase/integrase [Pseudomonas syringae]